MRSIWKNSLRPKKNSISKFISSASPVQISSSECQRNLLMINQHWFNSDNKPLPEPMLTKICVSKWCHSGFSEPEVISASHTTEYSTIRNFCIVLAIYCALEMISSVAFLYMVPNRLCRLSSKPIARNMPWYDGAKVYHHHTIYSLNHNSCIFV